MTSGEPSSGRSGCVLVVDDAAVARRELCQALEQGGFKVTVAAEGVEGLWRARETAFDLVVTDVHMPTMDGLQFLAELRRLPNYETTPVFVLTSDRSTERLSRGRQLGATAWVIKPPNLPALVSAVRDAVEARRSAAGAPETARRS
jgi:two-component system chemotaxis response regulator CheY